MWSSVRKFNRKANAGTMNTLRSAGTPAAGEPGPAGLFVVGLFVSVGGL